MVRKILGFLYKETRTLNQASLLLGLFALLAQVLGFMRDRLLAHIFGASAALDIYYSAFRIPDFIFITVASLVSVSVLIPFIVEKEAESAEALRDFVNNIFSFFSILIIAVSSLVFLLLPLLSHFLFKGFSAQALSEVVSISRILLLSSVLLGFSNLFGSLTQAYHRFTVYALSPILYNAGIVVGIILLAERLGVMGVAVGVVAGAALHLLVQVPSVVKQGLFPRFVLNFKPTVIASVVKISLPRTLTLSMSAVALIFLISLASRMAEGSISILSFATNLQSVPLSLIGVSYSLAAFPTLSRRFRENNVVAFKEQMATAARFIIFWSLPLSALFIVLRAQIVRVVLGSGLFSWDDTRLTAASLALFALSAVCQSLALLLIRGFYSAGLTRKPFLINFFSTVILVFSAWGLVKVFYLFQGFRYFIGALLKVEDLSDTAVLMLPLSFSLVALLNGLLLWFFFEREFRGFSKGVIRTFFEGLGSAVIIGAVAYLGLNIFVVFLDLRSLLGIFLQGLSAGLLALAAGIIVLLALKSRELAEIGEALRSQFWKTRVIVTDAEIV